MVTTDPQAQRPAPLQRRALMLAGGLLLAELLLIGTLFKHGISFNCSQNWPRAACTGASGALVALYCVLGATLLFAILNRRPLRVLTGEAGTRSWPLAVNGLGTLIALIPVLLLRNGMGTQAMLVSLALWGLGLLLLLAGLMLYIAPVHRWRAFAARYGTSLVPIILSGAALPSLATLIRPIWQLETITTATFQGVVFLVRGLGYNVETHIESKVIGAGSFYIDVAPQCSGIEGLALVTLFVSIYIWLFRNELRFPQALWLYPVGLIASATFNVLRISVLLIIGIEGNPELAVGGFHSHAGWLMFTLVSLAIVSLAQAVPALRKAPSGTVAAPRGDSPLPFFSDPVVAKILPFAVFMFSALLAQAFSQNPGIVYPGRVLLMAAALLLFWRIYLRFDWRIDKVAVAAGLVVGLGWVLIPVAESDSPPPFGALTGGLLVLWFIMRGIGTVLLVPIIEELFFRDYLERRLRMGHGLQWRISAAVVTAIVFALLHDRWAEAFVAGLVFSAVMARRDNPVDAIIAHMVANALVYAVVIGTGNIALI